jgi:hypothetical protein
MRMIKLAAWAALATAPSVAVAQMGPPIISCGQARAQVNANGAAVVYSSRHIYDRFVTSIRYCSVGETTMPAFIATTDSPQCFVGFRCVPVDTGRLRR